jgi:NADPH2:quinone reductase
VKVRVEAVRLVEHGQPLQIEQVDLPEPGPGEALVDIAYAGVNPTDMYAAQGLSASQASVPRTLGAEGAGTLEGRRVMIRGHGVGTTRDGVWATAAVVPRAALIDVPDGVDLEAAAAMGVAGVTAWRTVTEVAQVKADDTVLVLGATGGVGSVIVSLAHSIGATVAGQTGNADSVGWIKELGADHVVVADAENVAEAAAGLRPTVVFDELGGGFTGAAIEALAPHGRLVLFGTAAGGEGQVPLRSLYRKGISVLGYAGALASDEVIHAAIQEAMQALAAGKLTVPIAKTMPLTQVNEAFDLIRRREVRGKIVLYTPAT